MPFGFMQLDYLGHLISHEGVSESNKDQGRERVANSDHGQGRQRILGISCVLP